MSSTKPIDMSVPELLAQARHSYLEVVGSLSFRGIDLAEEKAASIKCFAAIDELYRRFSNQRHRAMTEDIEEGRC